MSTGRSKLVRHGMKWIVTLGLVLLGSASAYQSINNALGRTASGRSIDFHPFWYWGHQVVEGIDPYPGVMNGEPNQTLLESDEAGLSLVPSNTPLMLLGLSAFARFAWPTARFLFTLCNMALAFGVPLALTRFLPTPPSSRGYAALVLVFLAMLPTRNVISNGQTSLVVFFSTLLAVLIAPRNELLAGLLFGIALSKFSLVLPLVLWFLCFGYYRTVILAFGTQLVGVLLFGLGTATSPFRIITEYSQVGFTHASMRGDLDVISLVSRFQQPPIIGVAVSAIGVSLTLFAVARRYGLRFIWGARSQQTKAEPCERFLLFALLLVLSLPFIYHRVYDGLVLIMLPIALVCIDVARGNTQESWIEALADPRYVIAVLVVGVFFLPRFGFASVWPAWSDLYPVLTTGATLLAWCELLWLFWQETSPGRPNHVAGKV